MRAAVCDYRPRSRGDAFVAVGADAGADAADVRDEFGLVAAPLTYTISFGLACTVFPHPFLKCF